MDKSLQTSQTDITEEPYQGTGRFYSAAGRAAVVHLWTMLVGLVGAGTAAYIFHKPASKIVDGTKLCLENWGNSSSNLKSGFAKSINWVLETAEQVVTWFTERNAIKRRFFSTQDPERIRRLKITTDASIMGGGIGYISGFFIGGGQGVATANAGRNQLERAQEEIRDQRTENEALRKKYIETKLALEDLKTTTGVKQGKLRVAPEQPPMAPEPTPAPAEAPAPEGVKLKPKSDTPSTVTHAHNLHGVLDHSHAAEHAPT